MIVLLVAALLQSTPPQGPPPTPPPPSQQSPAPGASATPQALPTPEPAPTATTTPTPPPVVSPAPAASADPFTFVTTLATPQPATGGPVIFEVALNDRTMHEGGPILVRVRTSANVVGVEARCMGRFFPIPQVAPGLYEFSSTLPSGIPFFMLHGYDIVFAAATQDGHQTSVSVRVNLAH